MSGLTVVNHLSRIFSEHDSTVIVRSLHRDNLVWKSLEENNLIEQLFSLSKSEINRWSPGSLAAILLESDDDIISKLKDPTFKLPEALWTKCATYYESIVNTGLYPESLGQAGLLALTIRNHYQQQGEWSGVSSKILIKKNLNIHDYHYKLWGSAFCCLVDYLDDYLEFASILINESPSQYKTQMISLVLHSLICKPMEETDFIDQIFNLFSHLGPQEQIASLIYLESTDLDAALTKNLAKNFLELYDNLMPASTAISNMNLSSISSITNQFGVNPESYSNYLSIFHQAELSKHAGFFDKSSELKALAIELLNQNQANLYSRIGIENSTINPHLARSAFEKAQLFLPVSDNTKLEYARFLIENQGTDEALEILSSVAETPETRFIKAILENFHDDKDINLVEPLLLEFLTSEYYSFESKKKYIYKAIELLKSSRLYESAFKIVSALLLDVPNDFELLGYSSELLQLLGQPKSALEVTELMLMIRPENESTKYKLANLYIQNKEWQKAFDIYHKLIQSSISPSRQNLLLYASVAVDAGKPEIAIPICNNFLNQDQLDCEALIVLGNAYIASGKKSTAIEHMERATSLSPEKASSWIALANIWTKMEDFDHALDVLLKAKSALPEDPQILKALGISYMNSHLIANALPILSQVYRTLPDDIQLITYLSDAFLQLGNVKDAQSVIQKSPFDYTVDPKLALVTGKVMVANNELINSLPVLRFAYQSDNSEDSLIAYTNLLLKLSEIINPDVDKDDIINELTATATDIMGRHLIAKEPFNLLLLLADVNLSLGMAQKAYDQYVALLNQPESRASQSYQHIQYGIGLSALKLNLNEISLAALQEAVMSKPDDPKLRQALAMAFVQSNLLEEGIECAKATLQIANESVENVLWFSDFVIANGQPKLAISSLRDAIISRPTQRNLYLKLAQTYISEGHHSEAKKTIEKMVKMDDITEKEMHKAADIYLQMNELEDATRLLKNAIVIHSKPDFNILHDLAYSLALLGDFDGSIELLNNYSYDFINDDQFIILKSDIYCLNMQYEEASDCIETVLERIQHQIDNTKIVKPNTSQNSVGIDYSKSGVYHRKAQLDRIMGDYYSAKIFLDKAINENPTLINNQLLAMELSYSVGDISLAIECFDKIIASTDSFDTYSSILEEAATLRCEIALDAADYKTVSEILTKYLSQNSNSPTFLAIQARIHNHEKDLTLAESFAQDALKRIKEERQTQKSSLLSIKSQFNFIWNDFIVAKTAQELHMWDTAYELFLQILAKVQVIPIININFAEFLLYAFQNQIVSNALRIKTHAASFDATTDECRSQLESQISNASRFFTDEIISGFKVKANAILNGFWAENEPLKNYIKTPLDAVALLPILSSEEHISEVLRAFPGDFNLAFQNAVLSLEQDNEKCNSLLKDLFILDTTFPPLYALQALSNVDDLYVSTQSMETALSFWPNEPDWHCFLSEQYLKNSQFGLAAHHLEIAIDLLPGHAYYWQLLGEVKSQEKDITAARSYFAKACDIFPDNAEALLSLGQMNHKLGDLKSSLECFEKSISINPDCIETNIALVSLLLELGENEKSLAIVTPLLSSHPKDDDIKVLFIDALIANNKIEEANSELNTFIESNSESTLLKLKQIDLVSIKSGNEVALPLLVELYATHPDDYEVQLQYASELIKTNDLDKAETVLQHSLSLDPNQPNIHLSLGRIKRKKGQLDQAVSSLSQAITLDPSLIDAYIELGLTHQSRREQNQAIEIYRRAAEISPNDHRPLYHAGIAYRESKDYINAESKLRDAAQLAPNDLSIRRQLAGVIALNLVHNLQEPRNYEHNQ